MKYIYLFNNWATINARHCFEMNKNLKNVKFLQISISLSEKCTIAYTEVFDIIELCLIF